MTDLAPHPLNASPTGEGTAAAGPTLRHDGDEPVRVLIVDDEDVLRSTLARVLRQREIVAETAESGFTALTMLEASSFDVVLVDVRMPAMTGPQFLERVKAAGYPVEVLMMTAFADIPTSVNAVKAGAHGFLTKPFVSNECVVLEVLNAAKIRRLREKTERLQRELLARPPVGEVVGSGAPLQTETVGMTDLVSGLGLSAMAYPDAKRRILAEFNDAYVGAILKSTTGNMSEAARRSGLDRSNFRRLVRSTSVEAGAASARAPQTEEDD